MLNRGLEHAQEADAKARKLRDRKLAAEKRKRDLGRAQRQEDALRESASAQHGAQPSAQPSDGGANRGGAAGPAGAAASAGFAGFAGNAALAMAAEPLGPSGSACSLCRGLHGPNRCPMPAFLSVTVPLAKVPLTKAPLGRPPKKPALALGLSAGAAGAGAGEPDEPETAARRKKKAAKAAEQAEHAAWVESLSTPKMDAMIAVHRLAAAQVGARGMLRGAARPELPPKALREMSEVLEQFIVQRLSKH